MAHVSRPFQIFLVAFCLFVAVWFVALRDHTPGTTGAGSSAPVSQPAKPAQTTTHATVVHSTTTTRSGSASQGHTTTTTHVTVVKHPAVASRPATASATPSGAHGTASAASGAHGTATAANPAAAKPSVTKTHTVTPAPAKPAPSTATKPASGGATKPASGGATKPASGGAGKPVAGLPAMQVAVERQLQQGKTVLILFWNPKGSDDAVVHRELPAVQRASHGSVAIHYAAAKQVGEYGAITHAVQVVQTPTLLIVEPHGQTTTITGLTDSFAIGQTIAEARAAAAKTATK